MRACSDDSPSDSASDTGTTNETSGDDDGEPGDGYGNTNNIGDDELPSSVGLVPYL